MIELHSNLELYPEKEVYSTKLYKNLWDIASGRSVEGPQSRPWFYLHHALPTELTDQSLANVKKRGRLITE